MRRRTSRHGDADDREGRQDWDWGLECAHNGRHHEGQNRDLVNLMIQHGATNESEFI